MKYMTLLSLLQNASKKLAYKRQHKMIQNKDLQTWYINHFQNPVDDFERTYFQYKCQMRIMGAISIAVNLASFPLFFYYYLKKADTLEHGIVDAYFTDEENSNRIPDSLKNNYKIWKIQKLRKGYMDVSDRSFLKQFIFRYPFSWQMHLKCLIKLRNYSYIIHSYQPKTVVTCNEYSFTSSFLTLYCETKGIKHIDVMHGEKLYFMRDSFFRFHRIYVWHEHYIALFNKLRATCEDYVIEIPHSLRVDQLNVKSKYDYTYYLQITNKTQLRALERELRKLKNKGKVVAIRPHPKVSLLADVYKLFGDYIIEDCKKTDIIESIRNTNSIISLNSTVIFQGYCSGKEIVIDDLSEKKVYLSMVDEMYIGLSIPHLLLSDLVGK